MWWSHKVVNSCPIELFSEMQKTHPQMIHIIIGKLSVTVLPVDLVSTLFKVSIKSQGKNLEAKFPCNVLAADHWIWRINLTHQSLDESFKFLHNPTSKLAT
jgi:hypothetical protein